VCWEPSCPDRGARNMNTFRWTQQKSCRACRPLSLVVGMGASALIYNAATRKASPIDAPDGFLFTGAAASLPGGAAAVGLRHDFSLGVERAGVGLIEGSGADSVSLHELAGGPVVELAWSSPNGSAAGDTAAPRQARALPGVRIETLPLTVHWNQVLEFGLDHGRLAMAPHPNGGAIVAPLGRVQSRPQGTKR
jgi:hypothetical protein